MQLFNKWAESCMMREAEEGDTTYKQGCQTTTNRRGGCGGRNESVNEGEECQAADNSY